MCSWVFLKSCLVPAYKERHETSICKDTESRCVFKKKKKGKKERQRKKNQRMAVGNGNRKDASSLLMACLPVRGLRRPRTLHGHHSTDCSYHFFFFFAFPTFWYIYIYIFFTPWRYHYSNCSHMNTGVVSIGYKCVFYSILGPGLVCCPNCT